MNRTAVGTGLLALSTALCLAPSRIEASWVVISEVHHAPPGGPGLEFIEIWNGDPPRLDISGWTMEGPALFRFPQGATILPGDCVVVAKDPARLREAYPALARSEGRLFGPWDGELPDSGARIVLRNASRALLCEVPYRDRNLWPAAAAGTGHTLVLRSAVLDPSMPSSWSHSASPGGTPGTAPELVRPERSRGQLLVRRGEPWRYFRGTEDPPEGWTRPEFDASYWEEGPSGFGFADGDDATVIDDMRGRYLALYTRREFTVRDPSKLPRLLLLANYDDGFIASLNGREVHRANLPPSPFPVTRETPALGTHEAGSASEIDIGEAADLLVPGRNVIAVEVHNSSLTSTDLSLVIELEAWKRPARGGSAPERLVINEVVPPGGTGGPMVEIFHAGRVEEDVSGLWITDDPAVPAKHRIPEGTRTSRGGFASLEGAHLGAGFPQALPAPDPGASDPPPAFFLGLVARDGKTYIDAVRLDAFELGKSAAPSHPHGRLPDGAPEMEPLDAATPGSPNLPPSRSPLVITEVFYHRLAEDHPFEPGEMAGLDGEGPGQFVEIHNRGSAAVDLAGWQIGGGIRYAFSPGERIEPGAYLAIADEPVELARAHGLSPRDVTGPFLGGLANSRDRVTLIDPRGVAVADVEYSDRDPWPEDADAGGASLEIIHPDLDPSLAGSWAAGGVPGADWKRYDYEIECGPQRSGTARRLQVMLLDRGECLIDDVRIARADSGGALVEEDFEVGADAWTALGTHEGSGAFSDPAPGGGACYRIVASGRGGTRHNHVSLAAGTAPARGRTYRVGFRAKWLRGSPLLLIRFPGNALARTTRLDAPLLAGTPGAKNTAHRDGPGPVVGTPVQRPVAPARNQPVDISVRISSLEPPRRAEVRWRRDGDGEWLASALTDDATGSDPCGGDGWWTARIPPQPEGLVEFHVYAEDASGRTGAYPMDAPGRTALYAVGLQPSGRFPAYTLLVTSSRWEAMREAPRLSNRLHDATFVLGDTEIHYNVGFRPRGSPYTRRYQNNWRVRFGASAPAGVRSLTLDRQGGSGKPAERIAYQLVEWAGAPAARQRYVRFDIPGREEGLCEEVENVDKAFVERWYGGKAAGSGSCLYEIDDLIEMEGDNMSSREGASLRLRPGGPEAYRWHFTPEDTGDIREIQPLEEVLGVFDRGATSDTEFPASVDRTLDADEWLRMLAARTLAGDWDTLGRHAGKNAVLHRSPADGRWRLLPWDLDQSMERYPPDDPLFAETDAGITRLLAEPRHRRAFLGHIAYLAGKKLEPRTLRAILSDLRTHANLSVDGIEAFLEARRAYALSEVPDIAFEVTTARRAKREGMPDSLELRGTGPVTLQRVRAGGKEARAMPVSLEGWSAEVPWGPEGGEIEIEALDADGDELGRMRVYVAPE